MWAIFCESETQRALEIKEKEQAEGVTKEDGEYVEGGYQIDAPRDQCTEAPNEW